MYNLNFISILNKIFNNFFINYYYYYIFVLDPFRAFERELHASYNYENKINLTHTSETRLVKYYSNFIVQRKVQWTIGNKQVSTTQRWIKTKFKFFDGKELR